MLFGKRRKPELHKGDILLANGIYLKKPMMNNGKVLMNCFLRSIITFMLAFGCVGSFLSCFSVSYNYILVIVAYIVLSLYFSFLYSTSKLIYRDLGYMAFFVVFVGVVAVFRSYANSGLYSLVNIILSHAKTFFQLSGVREYDVLISNEYFTIAIFAVFIGVVLVILLNIWLSSTMSLFWTILLTFPILLIPLYMKLVPDSLYLVCLISGYLLVLVFKANGHFVTFSWDAPFRVKGLAKDKLNYTQDSKVFSHVLLSLAIMGTCIITLIGGVFPANRFEELFQKDTLRDNTADTIGNFLLLGFSGMYNRYDSTGGLAEGKLGGISNVRPDYQTDLIVTYTPYSGEAVYLKGYTGGRYQDNQWLDPFDESDMTSVDETYRDMCMKDEAFELQNDWLRNEEYSARGKMSIKNVGANPSYSYLPYYTLLSDYRFSVNESMFSKWGIPLRETKDYEYYPKQQWDKELYQQQPADMDISKVDEVYLDVPDGNQDVIKNECDRIGLQNDMSVETIVSDVQDYFEENIPYTLKPGSVPDGEDFINYFLTKNRKGYCAHFASAATLIFREMGIPARYVEGYAFSMENALASDENADLSYDDYFKGYASFGRSTVLDVEVDDSMAHAWVEIYIDGFGWTPVEVTPGSNEVVDDDDFWSAFRSMLANSDMDTRGGGNNFGTLQLDRYIWILYIIFGVFLAVLLVRILLVIVRKIKRFMTIHQRNRREGLVAGYKDICDMLRTCDKEFNRCKSHKEQLTYMKEKQYYTADIDGLCEELERISYSGDLMDDKYLQEIRDALKIIRKSIWKHASVANRIKLWKR